MPDDKIFFYPAGTQEVIISVKENVKNESVFLDRLSWQPFTLWLYILHLYNSGHCDVNG